MFCLTCQHDLASCTCADLKERMERIAQANLLIEQGYWERIEQQAERNAVEQGRTE